MKSCLLVLFLFLASPAWAQEVPLQIASLGKVFREGTTTTSSYRVPVDLAGNEVSIQLDINTADYEDPATRINMRLYRLIPGGAWQYMGGAEFRGGRYVDEDGVVNPPPTVSPSLSVLKGYEVRAEVETATRIRLGAIVEIR